MKKSNEKKRKPVPKTSLREILEDMAKTFDTKVSDMKTIYEEFSRILAKSLKSGKRVDLGFAIASVKESKPRVGINPRTGEKINIPAKKRIKFRVKKKFRIEVLGEQKGQKKK